MNDIPERCLGHSIRSADRVVSQIYNDLLAPVGIKITQFSILRALHYMGSTTAKEVQQVLVLEQATISRALKPLLRDGYIISQEGDDKRQKLLRLSAEGEALYQQALVPWNQAQTIMREELGSIFEKNLLNLSKKIVSLKD